MGADSAADRALVASAVAGERAAAEPLLRRIADTIWTACRLLTRDEADARQAFAEVAAQLQADRFRRLQPLTIVELWLCHWARAETGLP